MQHGLDSGRIAIHEEQFEEFRELVVDVESLCVFSLQGQTHHTAELSGQCIADDADDPHGPQGDEREGYTVVSADDVEVRRFVLDDVIHLGDVAAGFLDGHHILAVASQTERCLSRHVHTRTPGNVVEYYGYGTGLCYCLEVLVETLLRGLVVHGAYAQHAVDACPIR